MNRYLRVLLIRGKITGFILAVYCSWDSSSTRKGATVGWMWVPKYEEQRKLKASCIVKVRDGKYILSSGIICTKRISYYNMVNIT
jgi:hypothetical protein